MRGWRRRIILTLAFLLAGELAARTEDWVQFRTPFTSPYLSQDELLVRDPDGVHGRRGASFQKWRMNRLGMRGPAADSVKPPMTIRIVTAGASETFGVYETPGREFPRQLEDTLQAYLAAGRCDRSRVERFEVLNAAFRGMSLPTVEQDLRLRVRRFAPNVVLYYPTPPQYLEDPIPTAAVPDSSGRDLGEPAWRALRLRLADRLFQQVRQVPVDRWRAGVRAWRLRARGGTPSPTPRFDAIPEDRLDRYSVDLRRLVNTIRMIGAAPVLATHVNAFPPDGPWNRAYLAAWERQYPRAPARTIISFDSAAAGRTAQAASEAGATLVDLVPLLRLAGPAAFADFAHFTDFGAAVAAGAMARGVLAALGPAGPCQ